MNKKEKGFLKINSEEFLFHIEDTIDIFEIEQLVSTDKDIELQGKFKDKLKNEVVFVEDELNNEFDEDLLDEELDDLDELATQIEVKLKTKKSRLEDLVEEFNNGNESSFNDIYEHYRPILERLGKRQNDQELGIELLDIVLLYAVKTFDSKFGTKFNTYFWTCARSHIHSNIKKSNAQKRAHNKNMASLNDKMFYKGDSTEMELEKIIEDKNPVHEANMNELKMSIESLKDCLKENEIFILLKLIDNYTLQEIGDDLGVTAAAVCLSLKRISKKSFVAKRLKEILVK